MVCHQELYRYRTGSAKVFRTFEPCCSKCSNSLFCALISSRILQNFQRRVPVFACTQQRCWRAIVLNMPPLISSRWQGVFNSVQSRTKLRHFLQLLHSASISPHFHHLDRLTSCRETQHHIKRLYPSSPSITYSNSVQEYVIIPAEVQKAFWLHFFDLSVLYKEEILFWGEIKNWLYKMRAFQINFVCKKIRLGSLCNANIILYRDWKPSIGNFVLKWWRVELIHIIMRAVHPKESMPYAVSVICNCLSKDSWTLFFGNILSMISSWTVLSRWSATATDLSCFKTPSLSADHRKINVSPQLEARNYSFPKQSTSALQNLEIVVMQLILQFLGIHRKHR